MYKLSRYNLVVRTENGDVRLTNTLQQTRTHGYIDAAPYAAIEAAHDDGTLDVRTEVSRNLADLGMIVPSDFDELTFAMQLHHGERTPSDRLQLTIATTVGCNLNCGYCLEREKAPVALSLEDEAAIREFVQGQLPSKRAIEVVWFGGEPLANMSSIRRLSRALIGAATWRGVAYSASIITNGALLDDDAARELRRLQVRRARLTLDGPRQVHDRMRPRYDGSGSFDDVLRGIHVSLRYFDTVLGINLDRTNVESASDLLHQLASEGCHDLQIMPCQVIAPTMSATGAPGESSARFLDVPSFARAELELLRLGSTLGFRVGAGFGQDGALPCAALRPDHFAVEPGGHVRRCYAEVSSRASGVGAFTDGQFASTPVESNWRAYDPFDDECKSCSFLPVCYGGCPKLRMNGAAKEQSVCTPRKFNLGAILDLTTGLEAASDRRTHETGQQV